MQGHNLRPGRVPALAPQVEHYGGSPAPVEVAAVGGLADEHVAADGRPGVAEAVVGARLGAPDPSERPPKFFAKFACRKQGRFNRLLLHEESN